MVPGLVMREGPHVEKTDAVELAEELETLETGSPFDISGDVTGFLAQRWGDLVRVLAVRARKGPLAIVLLRACTRFISGFIL